MPGAKYNAHETDRMRELDGAQLASFTRRAIAFTLDLVIGWVLFIVLFVGVVLIMRVTVGAPTPGEDPVQLNFFRNWYSVLWWVLYFGLATYLWNGRTPGKRLSRIRVVSRVHDRLTLWHSIERALGYGASALELGFGFIQYFVHPNRRTVHDRIAESWFWTSQLHQLASHQQRPNVRPQLRRTSSRNDEIVTSDRLVIDGFLGSRRATAIRQTRHPRDAISTLDARLRAMLELRR